MSEPADRYAKIHAQFKQETERYLRDNTLYDVDRYGMGTHMIKLLLSGLAMHAMHSFFGNQGSSGGGGQGGPPAAATAPSTGGGGPFDEKAHPRETVLGGNKRPGEFAKKPGGGGGGGSQGQPNPFANAPQTRTYDEAHPEPAAAAPPAEPLDSQTAKVAEVWHGAKQGAAQFRDAQEDKDQQSPSPRNYPTHNASLSAGNIDLSKKPTFSPPPEHPLEAQMGQAFDNAMDTSQRNEPTPPKPEPEDKWWHDKAFIADVRQQQAHHDAPRQEEYDHMPAPPHDSSQAGKSTRQFNGTKPWQAGQNRGTVGMQDQEHADMHEIGSKLHRQISEGGFGNHKGGGQSKQHMTDRLNKLVGDYAYSNGVDEHTIRRHASDTYRANKDQAKGLSEGEHRSLTYKPFQVGGEQPAVSEVMANPAAAQRAKLNPDIENLINPGVQTPISDVMANPAAAARRAQPAESQEPQAPLESLMANPAAKERARLKQESAATAAPTKKAKTPALKPAAASVPEEKADVSFDPKEFDDAPEEKQHAGPRVKLESFTKRDKDGNITEQDHVAFKAAQKARTGKVRQIRTAVKKEQKNNPDKHVEQAIADHGLNHADFSRHIGEMEKHEQSQWKSREGMKSAIKKAWGMNATEANDLEDKGEDVSKIRGQDELAGNIPEHDLHEHLGADPHYWAANAHSMIKESPMASPGRHDPDWVESHATTFRDQQNTRHDTPEPEHHDPVHDDDGRPVPFSRRSLVLDIDRYFNDARKEFRQSRQMSEARIWTDMDSWL